MAAAVATAALLATGEDAGSQTMSEERYEACMRQAREKPDDGLATALAWEKQDGGPASRHCAAVAKVSLGQFPEAAAAFETVAGEMSDKNPSVAAELMAQAGQAWMMAKDYDRAIAAQTRGLDLVPENIDLLIERGIALAYQKKYWEALDDFTIVRGQQPNRADILTLMGAAYRYLEVYDLAKELIDEALTIEPDNPDALLERGIQRHLHDDTAGAVVDWRRVVELAPNSPPGDAAQLNLKMFGSGQ